GDRKWEVSANSRIRLPAEGTQCGLTCREALNELSSGLRGSGSENSSERSWREANSLSGRNPDQESAGRTRRQRSSENAEKIFLAPEAGLEPIGFRLTAIQSSVRLWMKTRIFLCPPQLSSLGR